MTYSVIKYDLDGGRSLFSVGRARPALAAENHGATRVFARISPSRRIYIGSFSCNKYKVYTVHGNMEMGYICDRTGWSVHQLPALDVPTWHDFKGAVP
jgi:hypothetical protein